MILHKLVTCSSLVLILYSLGILEHFTFGKIGVGYILALNNGDLIILSYHIVLSYDLIVLFLQKV